MCLLRFLVRGKMESRIHVCPKCGNIELKPYDIAMQSTTFKQGVVVFMKDNYYCEKCGYQGICPLINVSELKAFKKHLKDIKEESNNLKK